MASSCCSPGSSSAGSPRNLFTMNPATSAWSSGSSTATVPNRCASSPPRSMSPTKITGKFAGRARPMLTKSVARKLISAGDPAPSQITASNSTLSCDNSPSTTSDSELRCDQYSAAVTESVACPRITSCEVVSLPGLSRIGLNRTLGSRPAARACIAWARPISPPSTVTAELFDMFCALNGATRIPLRAKSRQSPATTIDFPASEVVPATSNAPLTSRQGEDGRARLGDQQGVLELRGPLAVFGDDGPAIVPDLVVQCAEVDHRLDGERHPGRQDRAERRVVAVQHDPPTVEFAADVAAGEVTNDVVAEPVCVGLDDAADHRKRTTGFDGFDRPHRCLVGALDKQPVL